MNIIDDDKSFGIDVGTRDVAYSGEGKIRLIQGDHNSERITFSMNRYAEQYDMSQCDKVEIHYINISSSGKERCEGVYTVDDVEINPTSENEIVFSWLVSVNATRYAGSVNFLILFRNVDAEGNVTYSWSTALNKEIIIGEGMNCGDDFEEAYSDILAQWEKKVAADIKADAMADEIKQNKTDDALTTEDKTVVGAINETARKQERLQYYGDANIVPTDTAKFKFTVDGGTASIDGFADGITLTDIVIPYKYVDDNGNEYRVTTISDSAFFHLLTLTSVIIPSTITEIEQYAFESCGLTSIYIPDSVITIGKSAFQSSTIKKVRLSNSLAEISEGVFATCPIEEIVIPDSVTSIGGAAFVFAKDTHITIPHNVTSLGDYVFEGCTSLLEVEILNDNIIISDDAFVDCTNVTIICGEGSTAETFCKAHGIPYRYNTVTDDFVITGTFENEDDTYMVSVTNVSCTYEEARAAFEAGKNVKCVFTSQILGFDATLNLMGYNDAALVFGIIHKGTHYVFAFTAYGFLNDSTQYALYNDYITTIPKYVSIKFDNMYSEWNIHSPSSSFETMRYYVFNDGNLILNALLGEPDDGVIVSSVDVTVFTDYRYIPKPEKIIFERTADNGKFRVTVDADDNWSGEYIQFATEETVSNLETQIGDINTAFETALNGGAS